MAEKQLKRPRDPIAGHGLLQLIISQHQTVTRSGLSAELRRTQEERIAIR